VTTGRTLALAIVAGLVAGVLTQIGQSVLPDLLRPVANAISPWLAVAFAVGAGAAGRRAAALGGSVALLFALVGYFGLVWLRFDLPPRLGGANLVWLLGALVGGPVFGLAGHWWRADDPWSRADAWRRAAGPALLGAAAIADGVYLSRIETVAASAPLFVVAGLLVPLVLGRTAGDRLRGLVALLPCLALGAAGFAALLVVYGLATGT
jgi:hypothetical protein